MLRGNKKEAKKVMMINFKIEYCQRTNQKRSIFHLRNNAFLSFKDTKFKSNTCPTSLIYVNATCELSLENCIFDGNKTTVPGCAKCIFGTRGSRLVLKDCVIRNHGGFELTNNKSDDTLVKSEGFVSILKCNFELNRTDNSNGASFIFEVKIRLK